jgi:molybdopterin-guanine dinucleotide biosynthesis protein A
MIFLQLTLWQVRAALMTHRLVVPVDEAGFVQPLCGVYSRSLLPTLEQALREKRLSLRDVAASLRPHYVQPSAWKRFDPHGRSFVNINHTIDLEQAEALAREEDRDFQTNHIRTHLDD